MKASNILAFSILALWVVGCVRQEPVAATGNGSAPQTSLTVDVGAIKALIAKDAELSEKRDRDKIKMDDIKSDDDFATNAALVFNYVKQARAISVSNIPTDLAKAYYANLDAWEEFAGVMVTHPHVKGFGESFAYLLENGFKTGPESKAWEDWKTRSNNCLINVNKTWGVVERMLVEYHAK